MQILRGDCLLSGPRFGGLHLRPVDERVRLVLSGERVRDAAAVEAALAVLDDERASLRDDERILFVFGYEAGAALDVRCERHPHDVTLGPDVFVCRMRVVGAAPVLLADSVHRPILRAPEGAHARHLARVAAAHELLLDGVIYQANLAHRVVVDHAGHASGLRFFLSRPPAPCAAFVDVPGFGSLVSWSPERFVELDLASRVARTYPIKGTRPRGATRDADDALREELCASTKDEAEHVMIVDLLRNDLGRIAVAGGVTVEKLLAVLSTPSVHHLETTIAARLRDDVGVADVLRATMPGGSITGAPKSSAIDVIAHLEEGPRGPYTGVLGVVDRHGRMASSLLIRTWVRPDAGPGCLHVGGGIVVDSGPEEEWRETLTKARAFGDVRWAPGAADAATGS